jgi:hypothetical protein
LAAVYSKQLYVAHDISTDSFTVPDGVDWVARTVASFCAVSDGGTSQLVDTATDATIWWYTFGAAPGGAYVITPDCRLVWPSGTVIAVVCNAGILGHTVDLGIWGYELTLP